MIDLLAILPWYLEKLLASSHLDALRVLRILRLFRLLRHSNDLKMFVTCISRSLDSFKLLSLFLGFAILIFSSLMWYAERGTLDEDSGLYLRSDGSESPFGSIPATFWWSIVTMTTVGYGDVYPVEVAGKLIATVAMIGGILVLALPLSIVGTNFNAVYEERQATLQMASMIAQLSSEHKTTGQQLATAASEIDMALKKADDAFKRALAICEQPNSTAADAQLSRSLCKAQLERSQAVIQDLLEQTANFLRSEPCALAVADSTPYKPLAQPADADDAHTPSPILLADCHPHRILRCLRVPQLHSEESLHHAAAPPPATPRRASTSPSWPIIIIIGCTAGAPRADGKELMVEPQRELGRNADVVPWYNVVPPTDMHA
eukprot:CAMPEP_0174729804 /NCGR_PEP_ID=MMETSP1094-20130205/54375_1 /TAXON_ID=156173 /ORGANISM="Chrysochromulina brevifilum, Strain UTEX LB 985" /LENGTH=375 /DNA_ID=CAMNT_0015931965 /DNA_START=101 /DNA_END=1230 /DNA_ORIENTATION=+